MIKGLSEIRRLQRIGKIHLGVKNKNSKGTLYPTAVDYFVVREDESTSKEIVNAFKAVYGDQPKELNINFPSNDIEKFFPQYLKRYGKGKLLCKGNGEIASEINPQTGEAKEIKCLYKDCPYFQKKQCRAIGNLQFFVQEIPGGIFQIDTSSYNSIINVNSAVDTIKAANNGRIAGIPLKLALQPVQVQADGIRKTVYVLNVYQPAKTKIGKPLNEPVKDADEPALPDTDEIPEDLFPQEDVPEGFELTDEEDPFEENIPDEELPEIFREQKEEGEKSILLFKKFINKKKDNKKFTFVILLDTNNNEREFLIADPKIYEKLKDSIPLRTAVIEYKTKKNGDIETLIDCEVKTMLPQQQAI